MLISLGILIAICVSSGISLVAVSTQGVVLIVNGNKIRKSMFTDGHDEMVLDVDSATPMLQLNFYKTSSNCTNSPAGQKGAPC